MLIPPPETRMARRAVLRPLLLPRSERYAAGIDAVCEMPVKIRATYTVSSHANLTIPPEGGYKTNTRHERHHRKNSNQTRSKKPGYRPSECPRPDNRGAHMGFFCR